MDPEPGARARHKALWSLASLVLAAGVFVVDLLTGSEISVSFFYLFPVALTTWLVGRTAGVVLSVLAAGSWAAAYFMTGRFYASPSIIYWNIAVEVATFLTVTLILSAVKDGLQKERVLKRQLELAYRRLDDETRVVGEIQRSLLPASLPAIPGWRLAVHYATSERAGGDYYDFFPLPGGRTGLLIADVSGHGTPAAVVMAMMRVVLHTSAEPPTAPERLLALMNQRIRSFALQEQFVTACYATLDPAGGPLEYALAGHNPPLVVRGRTGQVEEFENPSGPPLGIFEAPTFTRRCARLDHGDTVLFYTDGLTEALDGGGGMFGIERVNETLVANRAEPVEVLRDRLLSAMHGYTGAMPPADDVTLIVLRAE
jgi:sigma-B regulation protein RsbU (phosphoserine phosphatase)